MTVVVLGLVALAAVSLGLRTTSVLVSPAVQPPARLAIAILAGALMTAVFLELCESHRVFDFGMGLLISLSPVGLYDLAKWWFRWRNRA